MWFPPVDLLELSLLLLMGEILVLVTSKLLPPFSSLNFGINKKKLENTAIVAGILFLTIAIIRVISIVNGM